MYMVNCTSTTSLLLPKSKTFYTITAQNLVDKLQEFSQKFKWNSDLFRNYYINKAVKSNVKFTVRPVNAEGISLQLATIHISKSTGNDNIPTHFLNMVKTMSLHHLPITLPISILSGEIPYKLNQAIFTTLYKRIS